jgi:hypothetical protein
MTRTLKAVVLAGALVTYGAARGLARAVFNRLTPVSNENGIEANPPATEENNTASRHDNN